MKTQIDKAIEDSMICGSGFVKTGIRKWYNPMRWIKGAIYYQRINPSEITLYYQDV